MVEGTTVLLRKDLQNLFPDGEIWTERSLGMTKSYVVYKSASADDVSQPERPIAKAGTQRP